MRLAEDRMPPLLWADSDLSGLSPSWSGEFRNEVNGGVSMMSGVLFGLDPKPGELPMARLKLG